MTFIKSYDILSIENKKGGNYKIMEVKTQQVKVFNFDFEDRNYLMEAMRILDTLEDILGSQISKKLLNEYKNFIEEDTEKFSSFIYFLLNSENSLIFDN